MIWILSERFGLTVCFQVKTNTGMLQRQILFGADLNSNLSFLSTFLEVRFWELDHECWKGTFCLIDGIRPLDLFCTNSKPLRR